MLIFHEGLPRSGKSYAAFVDHVIKALKKGRHVFAYIEGLDHEKIAVAAELPLERVRELLHPITREQVPTIYQHVQNDALVVIDELQNFFPNERRQLSPEITQFVTEHGHRGLDVLCMGQVMTDCHKLWIGRMDTKIVFMKRDAIGKPDEYKWTVFKRDSARKFKETTSGVAKYDPRYFGCYKSHEDGTENTDNYADERANVKNSKAFKRVKLYGAVMVFALAFVVWFFATGGGMGKKPEPAKEVKAPVVDAKAIAQAENAKVVAAQVKEEKPKEKELQKFADAADYIEQLNEKGRIRLAGTMRIGKRTMGLIEWRDGSNRVIERFTPEQLQGLGWFVMISVDGGLATISRPGKTLVASQWPINDDRSAMPERVPEATQKTISSDTPGRPEAVALLPVSIK